MKNLILPVLFTLLLSNCAGLTPPAPGVPEAQYEKGLRFSEKNFAQPIDILQGVWNPADSAVHPETPGAKSAVRRGSFRIQIISLKSAKQAKRFRQRMQEKFPHSHFFVLKRGKFWAVQVGAFATRSEASRALKSTWRRQFPDAWIVPSK